MVYKTIPVGHLGISAQNGGSTESRTPIIASTVLCPTVKRWTQKWLPLEVPPLLPLVQSQVDYFHPQGQIKWSAHYNLVASQVVEAMGKPNKPDPYYCSLLCPVELHSPPCVGNDRSRTGNPRISINNYFGLLFGSEKIKLAEGTRFERAEVFKPLPGSSRMQ